MRSFNVVEVEIGSFGGRGGVETGFSVFDVDFIAGKEG